MAKIEYSRLICKRTDKTGVVPTIPAIDDITTFIATDIFVGEFFLNTADGILYTRDDSGIVTITTTGSSYLALAGGTMESNAVVEATDSLEIKYDDTVGDKTYNVKLDPVIGVTLSAVDNSNSDVCNIGITSDSIGIGSTDGASSASVLTHKDGRNIRTATKYDRVDVYPTIISGVMKQMGREVMEAFAVETTDATPTDCGTVSVLSSGGIHVVNVTVVGNDSGGSQYLGGEIRGVFYYDGTTITLIGTIDKWLQSTFTTADVDLITDGTDIIVQVTGEVATTINWTVTIKSN